MLVITTSHNSTLNLELTHLLDTNIFNRLADGLINLENLPSEASLIATHIQIDEINNTPNPERRARLFLAFAKVGPAIVPTESFVWDVSRWDEGKWSDGDLYERLKRDLDQLNGSKKNNPQDALIAEVAIKNKYTLITADRDLAKVAERHGSKVKLI